MATPNDMPTEQDIFAWLINEGVSRDIALTLSHQLFMEQAYWDFDAYKQQGGKSVVEWDKYVLDFEGYIDEVAKQTYRNQEQEKTARNQITLGEYAATYNPKTGRSWVDETELNQQKSQAQAIAFQDQQGVARQQAWEARQAKQPPMPSYAQVTQPTIESLRNLSPNLQRYYETELPNIYAQLGMAEKRQSALAQKTAYPGREPAGAGGEGWWNQSAEEIATAEAPNIAYQEGLEKPKKIEDPWLAFLSRYPFLEKYKGLTPSEKGFYSGQYAPRTRFF